MASMKDVAELAGVSVSTVSRVISGRIPVDEQTARRVNDAITSLDFRPNLLASGLRSKSGRLIGLVVPGMYEPFSSIVAHLERFAMQRGYSLLVGDSRSLPDVEEQFVDNLLRRHVDGIIFTPVAYETPVMSHILDSDIPIVWFDRVSEDRRVLSVRLNNRRAGELAAEHFICRGHGTFAVVTGSRTIHLCHERLAGFSDTVQRHGLSLESHQLYEGDFTFESGVVLAQRILKQRPVPTAVWAQNDLMAIGLLKGFHAAGVAVPEDISVIGMDGISFTRMVHPEITTISQPIEQMCRAVVSKVLEYSEYVEQNQLHTVFEPELIPGESVRILQEVAIHG